MPKKLSKGEEEFALHLQACHVSCEREYVFAPPRKWRIDFSWPERLLAVEIESSVHRIKGRFKRDIEKYNELQLRGWKLLRFTRPQVHSGQAIDTVLMVLGLPPR